MRMEAKMTDHGNAQNQMLKRLFLPQAGADGGNTLFFRLCP